MKTENNRLKLVLFAGGRGASTLISALNKHSQISLSIIVNAYDDGLSTGKVRAFIPGMLGPSDLRKNISNLLSSDEKSSAALKTLMEHRLPLNFTYEEGMQLLASLMEKKTAKDSSNENSESKVLFSLLLETSYKVSLYIQNSLSHFYQYCAQKFTRTQEAFDFKDCSIGNIILAGAFLKNNQDINQTLEDIQDIIPIKNARVFNVTDGENLVLVALKTDGTFLCNEAEIVSKQNESKIQDIYLLKNYLSAAEKETLQLLSKEEKAGYLSQKQIFPELNPVLEKVISEADIIVYGPGTQHSSLFPSYFTKNLGDCIAHNTTAEKIFISNILKDNEIQQETANSLTEKLFYYLNAKGKKNIPSESFAKKFFIQYIDSNETQSQDYVGFEWKNFPFPKDSVILTNWEDSPGKHSGGRVVDELVNIVNAGLMQKLKSFPHTVSIVIPCLNEAPRVRKVLHDVCLLDFQNFDLGKEIIFVDGGSHDGSAEIARSEKQVKVLNSRGRGRGEALKEGIRAATGNFIVFFPSDGEYEVKDLYKMVQMLLEGEFKAVFGSRAYRCVDPRLQAKEIYKGHGLLYFFSMYGGWILSILCLLLYNRYISDTLTSLKAFDSKVLKKLILNSKGVDLDLEIIAKLSLERVYIAEVPVNYKPRKVSEGKKITFLDGIKSIWRLLVSKYSLAKPQALGEMNREKVIGHHTSL